MECISLSPESLLTLICSLADRGGSEYDGLSLGSKRLCGLLLSLSLSHRHTHTCTHLDALSQMSATPF